MISKNFRKRIDRLIEFARASKPFEQKVRSYHVAAIFDKKRVLSIAYNGKKTNKNLKFSYPRHCESMHAELSACVKGGRSDYSGCKMVVIRIDNEGEVNMSKPCIGCQSVVKQFNLDEVIFSAKDGFLKL